MHNRRGTNLKGQKKNFYQPEVFAPADSHLTITDRKSTKSLQMTNLSQIEPNISRTFEDDYNFSGVSN